MATMLTIDGAMGEGGGQVLRTALGLSLVTRTPFLIERIRANRSKPGLQRQHLTGVLAAQQIGDAIVEGAELGSQRLAFKPRALHAGEHRFAIGTAGSTTLVLQAVLPALLSADGPSTVELTGGTHNPMAPPADFLQHAFAPVLHRMGASLQIEVERYGFYPAGGGLLRARIAKAAWSPLELLHRTREQQLRVRILSANLPGHIAEREAMTLRRHLHVDADAIVIEEVASPGPGNAVVLRLGFGATTEVVTSLAERSLSAEAVAQRAIDEARPLLASDVPVGEHLADQLLIPMALAGGGVFRTLPPTEHTRTNAAVVEAFLPVRFAMTDGGDGTWTVAVSPR